MFVRPMTITSQMKEEEWHTDDTDATDLHGLDHQFFLSNEMQWENLSKLNCKFTCQVYLTPS